MRILTKIILLISTTIIALIATLIITNIFKSQELEYYRLVEDIKTFQFHTSEALTFEKHFEKTFNDQERVYDALNKADIHLKKIHVDLLKNNISKINKVSKLLNIFRESFKKMEGNADLLHSKKEKLNTTIINYSSKYDKAVVKINKELSSGLFTITNTDPILLQVLKNDSLAAFTSINRIVVLINQDLILEGNLARFDKNYKYEIGHLNIQQKNIAVQVISLEEPLYKELSQQLTKTYKEIAKTVPELKKLYMENQQISLDLQSHKTEITTITEEITKQSVILRERKHKSTMIMQFLGQGSIMLFLLISGFLFARSITKPLTKLTRVTKSISGGDYSQKVNINTNDEIGQLANDFNQMRKNLKQSFELIDEQKKQYQSIFENAIEGIFQSFPDGKLLRVNHALAQILGYTSPDEMIKNITNMKKQLYSNSSDHNNFVKLLEKENLVRRFETQFKKKDNSLITVLINAQIIHDDNKKKYFIQGMIEDISERKRIEEYKIAKEAAEKSSKAKSEFLANMSHELRTPLNAILGFTQIISKNPNIQKEEIENLNIIQRSGEHLLTLINQVLNLSKIEAGYISLVEQNFNLYNLLKDVEGMFILKAKNKKLKLIFEYEDDLPQFICADDVKLRQILINLLNNAMKFTEKGSVKVKVSILSKHSEDSKNTILQFEISDTGPGISLEETGIVFSAFSQTTTGRKYEEGTGLGLTISRKFVRMMGGDIKVKSKLKKGTIFTFDIKVKIVKESEIILSAQTSTATALAPDQPKYRILIVDDKKDNRQLLIKMLNPLGFLINEAENGKEAISLWKKWKPHLIWMDIRMPKMDGIEATNKIKQKEIKKENQTIIIALTASSFEEDRFKVLECGCDDFLRKPFNENQIYIMLEKHLGVKFIYKEDKNITEEKYKNILSDKKAASIIYEIPEEIRKRLKDAVELCDVSLINNIINEIKEYNNDLANYFYSLVNSFKYNKILSHLKLHK